MKRYYNKNGKSVMINENRLLQNDEKWQLNASALKENELSEKCGLFEYLPPILTKSSQNRLGKLLFDDKKGTCTREIVDLTAHEIEQQEEEKMFLEYEAEQAANLEIEKSQKFASWKATKKDKATKNNIKNKN